MQHGLSGETDLSEKIIGCTVAVSHTRGCVFLEKVYENTMKLECQAQGLPAQNQAPIRVGYRDEVVGQYVADLMVEGKTLVEFKALDALAPAHTTQGLNYLKATGLSLALWLDFGRPKLEIKRVQLN